MMKRVGLVYLTLNVVLASYGQVYDSVDKVGIGTNTPTAKLDVSEAGGGAGAFSALRLRSGNTNSYFGNNQVLFSYSGTSQYSHAIKSRHNSGSNVDNALDFYVWQVSDNTTDVGSKHVMTLGGGNVGIGTTNPTSKLHVTDGSITVGTASGGAGEIYLGNPNHGLRRVSNEIQLFTAGGGESGFSIANAGWSGTPVVQMKVTNTGNVGVGTTSPSTRLDVHGDQLDNRISQSGGTYTEFAQRTWGGNAAILFSAYASDTYVNGGLATVGNTKYKYDASVFGTAAHGAKMMVAGHSGIHFYVSPASSGAGDNIVWGGSVMSLVRGGNVGIGTTTPSEKLSVNGTIRSKEVKVEASPWPDYVFSEDYELESLESVEEFIQSNGHLPEIPSAAEMEAEGLKLGEMNRLLLQKIEELTLYTIEQEKKIERVEGENLEFKIQNSELKQHLDINNLHLETLLRRIEKLERNQE